MLAFHQVSRFAGTAAELFEEGDRRELPDGLAGIVGGAVIDQDDFK